MSLFSPRWSNRTRQRVLIAAGAAISVALLGWLVSGDVAKLLREGAELHWGWVLASAACAAASYVLIALALEQVLALLGYTLRFGAVLGIGLVSTTANYFVSSMGVSGFALKAHLLRKRGVPFGSTVTASVVTSSILYLVLALIIAQGLLALALELQGLRLALMQGALALAVLLALTVTVITAFFNRELRGRVTTRLYHLANRGAYLLSRTEIPREDFAQFEEQLSEGLARVRGSGLRLGLAVLFTTADWLLMMASLWCAMKAVDVTLTIGQLSAGFTVGQVATLVPILPAGLGAVEGSMSALFSQMGVPWEKALAAALVFRVVYYLLPGAVSIVVLWGLKVSEPRLIEQALRETLPEELKLRARDLERRQRGRGKEKGDGS